MTFLTRVRGYLRLLMDIACLPSPLRDRFRLLLWAGRHTFSNRGISRRPAALRVTVSVGGKKAQIELGSHNDLGVLLEVFAQKVYDAPQFPASASTIVDLGANIGMAAVWFALRYPQATIHAFEPNPQTFARLRRHAAQFEGRIVPHSLGLGEKEGETLLYVDEAHPGASLQKRRESQAGISVRVAPLENLFALAAPNGELIDIVKFDIEGAEAILFSSPLEVLRRARSYIGEIHEDLLQPPLTKQRIIETLERASFRVFYTRMGGKRAILVATQES
ncbi:MAG: hypothetical protein KatS3mg100_122 [Candidatus Parcubacteria bacterium]|nr:MAG: hypothetical protein KatS3mg100_122 [Candidatus Parcubacteria bacterium]